MVGRSNAATREGINLVVLKKIKRFSRCTCRRGIDPLSYFYVISLANIRQNFMLCTAKCLIWRHYHRGKKDTEDTHKWVDSRRIYVDYSRSLAMLHSAKTLPRHRPRYGPRPRCTQHHAPYRPNAPHHTKPHEADGGTPRLPTPHHACQRKTPQHVSFLPTP